MAELNWIVPARRAVVAQPGAEDAYDSRSRASNDGPATLSYEEVLTAWTDSLREHRDRLVSWYTRLDDRGRSPEELARAFDRVVSRASEWRPGQRGLHPLGSDSVRATTGGSGTTASPLEYGLHVRLWKGPFRMLSEEADDPERLTSLDSGNRATRTISVGEGRHQTEVSLLLTPMGEVENADADFLPGDVIEFPIFKIWALTGIQYYQRIVFNGQGSFFLGTSVQDADGDSPGHTWLHDNMMSMRFQLMLNATIGSYCCMDPHQPFSSGGRLRKTTKAALLGKRIYARGIIYGGSHPNPALERFGGERWCIRSSSWGTGRAVPTLEALESIENAGWDRLTWGWACSPSSLTLAYYLLDIEEGWQRGGSPNRHVVEFDDDHPLVRTTNNYYFAPMMYFGERGHAEETTRRVARRAGLPSSYDIDQIQQKSIRWTTGDDIDDDGEEHEIDANRIRDDICGAFSTVGLNGHIYSWIVLRPHRMLMTRDSLRYEMMSGYDPSQPGRPPCPAEIHGPPIAGFMAAYNPLTGNGYTEESDGQIFVFDTAGSYWSSRLTGPYRVTTFTGGPSRWAPAGPFHMKRTSNSNRVYIGDGHGARSGQETRSKPLVSIVSYHVDDLEFLYSHLRRFRPIAFHKENERARVPNGLGATVNLELDIRMNGDWYRFHASPFPTLVEADRHGFYPRIEDVRTNLRALRNSRPGLIDLVRSTPGVLTDRGRQQVESRSNFQRRVERHMDSMLYETLIRRRQLQNLERRLERRLQNRSEAEIETAADEQQQELDGIVASRSDEQRLRQLRESEQLAVQRRQAAAAENDWNTVQSQTETRDGLRRQIWRLNARLASVEARRRRALRRMPELRLRRTRQELERLERQAPNEADVRGRAEQNVYRPWAERWQRILHDLGNRQMPRP